MEVFKWLSFYSVGNKQIDDQHKRLIKLINQVYYLIKENKSREKMTELINELEKYTVYHFNTEEKYFEKYEYPKAEEHIKEHQAFTDYDLEFKKKFYKDVGAFNFELFSFLKNWLHEHIVKSDKEYGRFFNKNNKMNFHQDV